MARGKHLSRLHRAAESIEEIIFAGGWAANLAHRLKLQGRVETRFHELSLSGAASPAPPLRVSFASDFHAGPLTHPNVITRAFDNLAAASPDIVLFGGDYISFRADYIDIFCEGTQTLKPPQGMYAVLGNHDLWADDALIVERLQSVGIRVLINESVRLRAPYEHVFICGLDDPFSGAPDPARTFAQADGVRILLMHSPSGLPLLGEHRFEVAFTGHTHGGQIALPGGVPLVMPRGHAGRKFAHGHFRLPNNQGDLIVSKGVGVSGLPVRLFAHSEVHVCTIKWCGEGA